jgi:NitT/TauT family transport system substrate-binding protein
MSLLRRCGGAAALAALALIMGTSAPVRAADAVRVGLIPVDTAADAWYAQEQGFFKQAGLDVTLQPMASGPVLAQAVIGGAVDIGVANVATIAAARERGIALKFIAPAAIAEAGKTMTDAIMVAKGSPIKTGADLNGKTIGVNGLRDLQQIEAMGWVDKHGGDSKTLKFVEVPVPQMTGALESHRVDAALPIEPFVTAGKNVATVIGEAPDGVAPRYMVVGWFASDAWLNAHPDLAAKFATAMRQAAVWANAHQKESAAILVRNSKLSAETANTMARATYGLALDPALIQPVIDDAVHYGILSKPLSASELIWRAPATH